MLRGLHDGKVLGAALDVQEQEDRASMTERQQAEWETLRTFEDRLVLTPHIAGWTVESKRKLAQVLLEKIRAIHWD